jgi:succinate dehydrogenase / fumarate reductase, cytochrome b subunit
MDMSAVAANPVSEPGKASRSRLARVWGSSIGLKIAMAITGVILSGFVLVHMAGNLQVFQGEQALNDYAKLLRAEPALLWTARLVLLASVGLHIVTWLALARRNQQARPVAYRMTSYKESSYASRTMRWTGPLVLAFIIYHVLHMTTGTVHPSFHEGSAYHNLVAGLRVAPVAVVYVLAMAALGFHLWHGVWSLFQTLGAEQARYESLGRRTATIFTVVVVLGFTLVPLAIVTGFVK